MYARLQNVQLSAKNLLLSLQLQVYRDTLRREKKRPKISEWMRRLFVWTLRQTLLNYLVPLFSFSESVIRQRLLEYKIYFNEDRTHSANGLDSPLGRETPESSRFGKLVAIPCVGGLHHRYSLIDEKVAWVGFFPLKCGYLEGFVAFENSCFGLGDVVNIFRTEYFQ